MMHLEPDTIERVLAVKLTSLGDIVHVTPCLRALRRHFRRARIVLAVDRRFADVVRYNPHVDELIEAGPRAPGRLAEALATWPCLGAHRRTCFDVAIDFQGVGRSALYVYRSRAKVRAGRGIIRPGWDCVVRPDLGRHAVLVCADIAAALGVPVPDLDPEIFLSPEADRSLGDLLASAGLPPRGFLLLNPFSRWHSKEWPLDRYAELVRMLARDWAVPVVISGSADRLGLADCLMGMLGPGRAVSLVGRLSLTQAMCLYGRSAVMVTGDSGPMHVAAALGTKLVALFGPTFPERTGPWGAGHRVIQERRPRSHYSYLRDRRREHIAAIDVATVYRAVSAALGEWASSQPAPPVLPVVPRASA